MIIVAIPIPMASNNNKYNTTQHQPSGYNVAGMKMKQQKRCADETLKKQKKN